MSTSEMRGWRVQCGNRTCRRKFDVGVVFYPAVRTRSPDVPEDAILPMPDIPKTPREEKWQHASIDVMAKGKIRIRHRGDPINRLERETGAGPRLSKKMLRIALMPRSRGDGYPNTL